MTGWSTIKKIREFEKRAAEMGFVIREPDIQSYKHTGTYNTVWIDEVSTDQISLSPAPGRYPGWGNRGGAVFTGTIEQAVLFLQGIDFAYISDAATNLSSRKKREAAEARLFEKMRRQEEERIKKEEQKKIWELLKYKKQREDNEVPF